LHVASNFGNNDWHLCPSLGNASQEDVIPILIENGFQGMYNLELNLYPKNRRLLEAYIRFCAQSADAILAAYGLQEPK
jgi:hypothetical protein